MPNDALAHDFLPSDLFPQVEWPTADGAIENQPQFKDAATQAWKISEVNAMRKQNTEAGFTVADGKPNAVTQGTGSMRAGDVGNLPQVWYSNTETALHTHPPTPGTDGRPSPDDVAIAKRQKKPVMVLSKDGLFEVDAQGNMTQVYKGLDWLSKKKK